MISKITKPKKNKIRLILLLLLICFSNCKDEPIDGTFTDSDNDGTKDVLASIIYDGSNYMLMLKSESGASNEMKVTDSHSTPAYAYDTTDGAQLTQRVAGVNSAFTVDGISMSRTSNSVDDLFDGFTLDLKKTSSSAVRISSSVDLEEYQLF